MTEVDARIQTSQARDLGRHLLLLPGLIRIDLCPPASGPELELTFRLRHHAGDAAEAIVRDTLQRLHITVLAIRSHPSEALT